MPKKHNVLEDHELFWNSREQIKIHVPDKRKQRDEWLNEVEELEIEFWDMLNRTWFASVLPKNLASLLAAEISIIEHQKFYDEKKRLPNNMQMVLDDETFENRLSLAADHIKENLMFRLYAVANQLVWEFRTLILEGVLTKKALAELENHSKTYILGNTKTTIHDGRGSQRIHDPNQRLNVIVETIIKLHIHQGLKAKEITQERVAEMVERVDGKHVERFTKWFTRNLKKQYGHTWRNFVLVILNQVENKKAMLKEDINIELPMSS